MARIAFGMDLRLAAASLALRAGLTLGRRVDPAALRGLLNRLHPVIAGPGLIRVGGAGDGGYLIPDDLDGLVGCFSPGVGRVAQFESALVALGIPCFLADASVEGPPVSGPLVHFEQSFLGPVDAEGYTTLTSWVGRHAPAGDLLLQMDIEGAEWPALLAMPDPLLDRFRMIVVEFHDLDRLFDRTTFQVMAGVFGRLLARFHLVHIHPNNWSGVVRWGDIEVPRVMELTWLRRDRGLATGSVMGFPHALDQPCRPERPELALPPIWYRRG